MLFACGSNRSLSKKFPGQRIAFGKGGGFTGQQITYVLSTDGVLMLKEGIGQNFRTIDSISAYRTRSLFDRFNKIDLNNINLNEPGNNYFFLEKQQDSSQRRISWGKQGVEVPEVIKVLHTDLMQLIPKQ